jgi:hypothetical protein
VTDIDRDTRADTDWVAPLDDDGKPRTIVFDDRSHDPPALRLHLCMCVGAARAVTV